MYAISTTKTPANSRPTANSQAKSQKTCLSYPKYLPDGLMIARGGGRMLCRWRPVAAASQMRCRPSSVVVVVTPYQYRNQTTSSPRQTSHHYVSKNLNHDVKINIKDQVKIISLGQGIVNVLLSRPNKLNSLDIPMFEAIAEAASRLRDDTELNKDLRVVIISGEGRAFCSGLDAKGVALSGPKSSLNALLKRPSAYGGNEGIGNLAQDVCYLWRKLPVPVIAVLHGYCFGGGLQIACGADMRFSTPDCKLSIMESRWGLIPDVSHLFASASVFLFLF
jgi:hypothetical protein